MTEFLQHYNRPFIVVGTKRDKLKRSQWQQAASVLRKTLNLHEAPLLFSAGEEASREVLWDQLIARVPGIDEPDELI
jgi:GTP-binding protein